MVVLEISNTALTVNHGLNDEMTAVLYMHNVGERFRLFDVHYVQYV